MWLEASSLWQVVHMGTTGRTVLSCAPVGKEASATQQLAGVSAALVGWDSPVSKVRLNWCLLLSLNLTNVFSYKKMSKETISFCNGQVFIEDSTCAFWSYDCTLRPTPTQCILTQLTFTDSSGARTNDCLLNSKRQFIVFLRAKSYHRSQTRFLFSLLSFTILLSIQRVTTEADMHHWELVALMSSSEIGVLTKKWETTAKMRV